MARTGISIEAGTAPGNREAEPMEQDRIKQGLILWA